jgi:hypothetical protein
VSDRVSQYRDAGVAGLHRLLAVAGDIRAAGAGLGGAMAAHRLRYALTRRSGEAAP